jgi:hypothetical protein
VISQLIDYLIHQPSDTASPMAVALSASALLSELGSTVTRVNLVDNRDTEMNPPYVRLWDTGEVSNLVDFVAGQKRSYIEKLFMGVECAAYGPTPSSAGARADYLRLAAEGAIQPLISGYSPSDLPGRTDLAGSGATDEIFLVRIVGGRSNPVLMGPGDDVNKPHWTATRNFRVEVQVKRTRLKAA